MPITDKPTVPLSGPRPPATPTAPIRANAAEATAPTFGVDATTLTAKVPTAEDLKGLTPEEAELMKQGFLPTNFAALRAAQQEGGVEAAMALYRKDKKGPFHRQYGDPNVMLEAARRFAKYPELGRMAKDVKPGDILLTTFNKDKDAISVGTKGPFIHALICVAAGPPAEFIEALGASGDMKDPASNKVLRSMIGSQGFDDQTLRIVRPTENLPPGEADKAIKRAIAYATDQLGKPYDFAFTNKDGKGMNDAFYCSELAYKSYAHPKGANIPFALDKAPERDEAIAGVGKILDALGPEDKGKLTFDLVQLAAKQPLTNDALVDFLANEVLPKTDTTRKLADTPERKEAVEKMLTRIVEGKAMENVDKQLDRFSKDEAAGRYKGFLGFFRRIGAGARIGWAGLKDARALTKGVGFWRSLGVTLKLAKTVTPHAETITRFLFGKDDARTKQARSTLDTLDGMARDVSRVPLIGGLLGKLWPLPKREPLAINRDFVSPTDIAWAPFTHSDYNVKPNTPVDKPAVEAKQPTYTK